MASEAVGAMQAGPIKDWTAKPTHEYRDDRKIHIFQCSLQMPDGAVLPLFLTVGRKAGRMIAELESDQTDYNKPGMNWTIKRAYLRGLRFWRGESTNRKDGGS